MESSSTDNQSYESQTVPIQSQEPELQENGKKKKNASFLKSFSNCWKTPETEPVNFEALKLDESEDGEGDWLKFFSAKEKEKAVKTNERLRNQRSKSCIPAEGEGLGGKSQTEEVKSEGPGGRKVKFEEDKYEMIADSQMAETQKGDKQFASRAVPEAPDVWSPEEAATLIKAVWRARETRRSMPHITPLTTTTKKP